MRGRCANPETSAIDADDHQTARWCQAQHTKLDIFLYSPNLLQQHPKQIALGSQPKSLKGAKERNTESEVSHLIVTRPCRSFRVLVTSKPTALSLSGVGRSALVNLRDKTKYLTLLLYKLNFLLFSG